MKPPVVLAAVLLALAGCGSAAPEAPAPDPQLTQDLVPLTTAQAAHKADRIALVVAGGSRVVEAMPGTPFTRTRFSVERTLKGTLPRTFVLQVIGGRLGDVLIPSPVPAFGRAHRYVLFLGPDGPAGPTIFPQAVFDVTGGGDEVLATIRRALR